MKILLWTCFALLALLWSGSAWLTAEFLQATAAWLAQGEGVAERLTQWRLPLWALQWVDIDLLQAAHAAVVAMVDALQGGWPLLARLLRGLVPVMWAMWGLGLLLMLAATLALHRLLGAARPA